MLGASLTYTVIAADGLYKRDVFRESLAYDFTHSLLNHDRFPRPVCSGYRQRRADQDDRCDQEDTKPLLE